jgi:hypothetical protein
MIVIPLVVKQTRSQQVEGGALIEDIALNYNDVEAFLNADTEADFQGLMGKYSSLIQSLYGFMDVVYAEEPHSVAITALNENDTIDDYLNLKSLLVSAMKLCALVGHQDTSRNDIEKLGIGITEGEAYEPLLSLRIELKSGIITRRFLDAGIDNFGKTIDRCFLSVRPDSLEQTSTFYLAINCPSIFDTPRCLHSACEAILNTLSKIMLHDVSIEIRGGKLLLASASIASSLWCILLEQFREGRADYCRVCNKPFIALDERKNKRLYCSGACNKMHQRLSRYNKMVIEGYSDEDAAKAAGVNISRARDYWKSNHHPTDPSAQ